MEIQFTNHSDHISKASVEPVLPPGWKWNRKVSSNEISIGGTEEGSARVVFAVPAGERKGLFVIPFRVTFNGKYLGQICHAYVYVI